MRLAFVLPWAEHSGRLWAWNHLPDGVTGDLFFAAPDHTATGPGETKLPPYLAEYKALSARRPDFTQYDMVFAWELRSALATSLLIGKIPEAKRPKFVAVGPILKGSVLKLLPLIRPLLARAEKIICFSEAERELQAKLLNLPPERFLFWPTPYTQDDDAPAPTDGGFALALGQSNRDYGTLLRAVEGTEIPLTVVAGDESALGGVTPGPNVTVKYNTGHHETMALIASARFHTIPLHNAGFSSGQTVLLRAQFSEKACIVSDTPGVRDYVKDGETALLVPPEDIAALRAAMLRLWTDDDIRTTMGQAAKSYAEAEFGLAGFAARCMALARGEAISSSKGG
ncbi:MAG: glycosyltransferase family 4 protein [Armatimonas sp.]